MDLKKRIKTLVRSLSSQDGRNFGLMSTGEKIAIALVLDRPDLIAHYGTALEAVDRLGPEWTHAALEVQKEGWEEEIPSGTK